MNTVLVFEHERIKEREDLAFLIQDTKRIDTIKNQLKLKADDQLHTTFVNHGTGTAIIQSFTETAIVLHQLKLSQPQYPQITLLLAAARPPTMKKILEHATTMGVTRFIVFCADLTEKSYLDSKVLTPSESAKYIELGLSQARERYFWPTLDILPQLPQLASLPLENTFTLDLGVQDNFLTVSWLPNEPLTLLIGPERGWSPRERAHFAQVGIKSICLSRVALRVEHAVFSALAQIELCQLGKSS